MDESEKFRDRLEKLIQQKTAENEALNKLLGKLISPEKPSGETFKEDK